MLVRFEYRALRAPFRHPVLTAHGTWTERESLFVRLTDDTGHAALGEIAPLPAWGSERLEQAQAFCASLPPQFDEDVVRQIPAELPCCRFAFETAWDALRKPTAPVPVRALPVAALLPAGPAAVEAARQAAVRGFGTMKWKVGVGAPEAELALLPQVLAVLPPSGRLRLDANGAWDLATARRWLEACAGQPVEFIEQPFPVGQEAPVLELAAAFPTRIALDESVAQPADLHRWLEFGWPGIYVVKPALAGSPHQLLRLLESYEAEAVFSSAFETAVGARAALLVAARADLRGHAVGFGTIGCFADARLNLPEPGPTLSTKWLARLPTSPLWDLSSPVPPAA